MGSQDTAKATALSFFSFPPEVRLQIYGHLLVHNSAIEPKNLRHSRQALSNSRLHPTRDFRLESAILRTCHQIYLEALPVLYGENTFLHSCNAWIFTPHDYLEVGFPDQNIQQIKHLELQVQPKLGAEGQVSINFGATVQYFVDRGCDLQTFRLWLNELGSTNGDDDRVIYSAYGENTSEHIALWLVAHSDELLTALVGLKVSKTLTISLSYSQKMVFYDETQQEVSGIFRDHLIKSLAFQKNFTVTEHMGFDIEFLGDKEFSEDREDDGSKDDKSEDIGSEDSEFFDEDDAESYFTWYGFSWCLRPQHSKAQTDSASA